MKRKISLIFSMICVLSLTACLPGLFGGDAPPVPTQNPSEVGTVVIQTVAVRQTIAFLETQIALGTSQATLIPTVRTATSVPHTATPTFAPSATPAATATPLPPTITSTAAIPCNAAVFITDVSYPDGSVVAPEQSFLKTWRLKNDGTCAWSTGYALAFASGSKLGGPDAVSIPVGVKPGETVDLSVSLLAPKDTGDYVGYWQLRATDGLIFGTGGKNSPFWVKIKVGSTTMSGTRLVDNICTAIWKSNSGSLPCPAPRADFTAGAVMRVDNPKLEGAYQDNEPALVMIPNDGASGKITGTFPAFGILSGDHFVTLLGCMDNTPKCNVSFKLSYTIDGTNVTDLLNWDHAYTGGGSWKSVNIDLSSLAGQSVKFILSVTNYDGHAVDDQAFWLAPQIKR